jgi:hypothetical protein
MWHSGESGPWFEFDAVYLHAGYGLREQLCHCHCASRSGEGLEFATLEQLALSPRGGEHLLDRDLEREGESGQHREGGVARTGTRTRPAGMFEILLAITLRWCSGTKTRSPSPGCWRSQIEAVCKLDRPHYYTVSSSCISTLAKHLETVTPMRVMWDKRVYVSGYSSELMLLGDRALHEARAQSLVTADRRAAAETAGAQNFLVVR